MEFSQQRFIKKIINDNELFFCICLWNDNNIFVGTQGNNINLINTDNGEIISRLFGHKSAVSTIKKIIHQKYGECLVSYGSDIKLWIKNK